MKKCLIPVIVILVIVFGFYNFIKGFNNTAIALIENVSDSWAHAETSYQRRTVLIGNLVNTGQGAADVESGTLVEVIEVRAKATSVNIDPSRIIPAQLALFNKL
jgi:LemA protein